MHSSQLLSAPAPLPAASFRLCFQRACGCRAEVLVQCDGSIRDSYYLSSGYLKTFGSGCAINALRTAVRVSCVSSRSVHYRILHVCRNSTSRG
jgi:hypothetical protein